MFKKLSSEFIKFIKGNLATFFLLAITTLIFFFRVIFIDKSILFISDIRLEFTAQLYSSDLLNNGILPLWDPYHYGHFIAFYVSAVFYPLNIVMRYLFPANNTFLSFRIYEYFLIFHYFLA